jgi:uncharacterized protein
MLLYVQARFEWDEAVAALAFDDPNHRSEQDRFVNGEERWQTVGLVNDLLLVCHTWTEETSFGSLSWLSSVVSASLATRSRAGRRQT